MRIPAAILLITAALLELLLGGLLLVGSRYERFEARAEAGDLSAVSADLATPEQLAAMEREADRKTPAAGLRPLLLGLSCLAAAVAALVGGVLLLLRRAPLVSPLTAGLGVLAMALVLGLDGPHTLAWVTASVALLAGILAWLARPGRPAEAPPAEPTEADR